MWGEVGSVELDESIYGKAKIAIRDKDGYYIKILYPKWHERYKVLQKINKQWINYLKEKQNGYN